jgi:serine/threonine-protein kinase
MARERDILAALEHPNIARFYDAGIDAFGRPFMAMEYVEGQSIDAYSRDRQLSIRQQLTLILDVAKAVAFAHSKLVIHRDLKPANMLVTAEGAVRLLDFGIAKLVESDSDGSDARVTQLTGRMLTPDYASPEQIRGQSIGTATDVYSLAVVAYELLAGTRPYRLKRNSAAELAEAIADAEPRLASDAADDRHRSRQLRGDLDAILNKAMKKNAAERYATVDAFAEDVQRYLDGKPVVARPDGSWYRLRKFAGRHRMAFGATSVVLLALVVATSVSLIQAHEAKRQAEKATAIKDFLLHVFAAGDNRAAGSKPLRDLTALELLDKSSTELLGVLDNQPAVKLELIEDIGDVYERMDALDKEMALYREGIRTADRSYGPNSRQKAQLLALIAGAQYFAGHWLESEQAVAEAERAFDASGDHASIYYAQLLKSKGSLLRAHGPSGAVAARQTLQRAAALFARRFPDNEGYVGVLMYLASADLALDDMRQAKAAADGAVAAARRLTGDASELAHSISLRASVEDELGETRNAERDYLEASQLYASSVGKRHFFYLQNENLRGQLMHLEGRREEGLRLLEETTAEIEAVRPASNTLANSLTRLTEAYLRDGAFESADQTAGAVVILKPAQTNSVLLTRVRLDRAQALIGLGRFSEAAEELMAAARAAEADGQASSYTKAELDLARAAIGLATENMVEAQTAIDAAQSKSVGDTRRLRHQRGRILIMSSRIAAARGDLRRAVASASTALGMTEVDDIRDDVFLRSEALTYDGAARCSRAPSEEAAEVIEQALTMRLAIERAGSPLIADSQLHLARCRSALGQSDRAKGLVAQAEQIIGSAGRLGPQYSSSLQLVKLDLH